ncbi:dimethylarginine dimethylaminohydrolase family protein [Sporosarcina jiandibaonis]|uniref:dimethylarginine dimethylaminohydrolase family protein n=1 Tax=Sporosarcina jiandibaonis TaxID=2715535 RepID=UPI001556B0AE|nr:dimethylarginine dimethylaminohydrolase family protein [Sporosarcina jiandibaonis]
MKLPKEAEQNTSTGCRSEYDTLQRVIVCEPKYMEIQEVINEVQAHYKNENINKNIAKKQHEAFLDKLEEHDVEVIRLPASEQFPEQVFTRDIGFTLGDDIFIAEMGRDIREGEEKTLERWLQSTNTLYNKLRTNKIEGGDVIIDRHTVFVGISSRTSMDAVHELSKKLPEHEVIPIRFNESYLHLDCVFNILSPRVALIFPKALDDETVQMLASRYTLIEVSEEEQFTLGTNVLSIGDKKVFSLPQNTDVNRKMRDFGFNVIEVDFSEIIKSGGSFRCCSMPVERE